MLPLKVNGKNSKGKIYPPEFLPLLFNGKLTNDVILVLPL